MFCCKRRQCFTQVNIAFLRAKVSKLLQSSNTSRRQYLFSLIGSDGAFIFDGRKVCTSFLSQSFHFSRDLQSAIKVLFKKGKVHHDPSTANIIRRSDGKDSIICFLERLANDTADKMPDTEEQHLPFFQKKEVYELFCKEFQSLHISAPPSIPYFSNVWIQFCNKIKVRKVSRFSKCTICEDLRDALKKAATEKSDTSVLLQRRRAHHDMVARERREYRRKKDLARLNPSGNCSIIIDGADQSAFGLPHFATNTKDMRGITMKVRLVGLLEHAVNNHLYLFTLTEEFETGANHVIEAVHRFLVSKSKKSVIPGSFFVQVDNCTRENKNRYFLSYMESLVAWNVFERVEVAFLPVGHTHEDIDQQFSCTSRRLRSTDAITLNDLHEQLRLSFKSSPYITQMKSVANFSGLCEAEKCVNAIQNFSHFRYFKFSRSTTQNDTSSKRTSYKTVCHKKIFANDEWTPLSGDNESGFLKFAPDLKRTPPTVIEPPNGVEDVTARICSVEGKINDENKYRELIQLREHIYQNRREDRFHWDLRISPEHKRNLGSTSNNENNVEIGLEVIEGDTAIGNIRNRYSYTRNSFVAIKPDSMYNDKFWIGKVISSTKNGEGIVTVINVHWFEAKSSTSSSSSSNHILFSSVFVPLYEKFRSTKTKRIEERPYKEKVNTDTVLCQFDSLTKKQQLPAEVKKYLLQITA